MKLRCFAVDARDRLWLVPVETVRRVWLGRAAAPRGRLVGGEFRVLTVVCDRALRPRLTYFSRLRLEHGRITPAERARTSQAIELGNLPDLSHPLVDSQLSWAPENWQWQLAVALDVPLAEVGGMIGVGGPLQMADIHGLPLVRFLEGYAEAFTA